MMCQHKIIRVFFSVLLSFILFGYAGEVNADVNPEITTYKDNYAEGESVWIEVKNKPGNAQDWIGIYPAGSNNSWTNVVAWRWAYQTSLTVQDPGDWYKFSDHVIKPNEQDLVVGNYEARFFLNNSYVVEDSIAFSVGDVVNNIDLTTYKDIYSEGADVWIKVENKPGNAQDWMGIYPAGTNNDWGNEVAWRWAYQTSQTAQDAGDWYKFSDHAIKANEQDLAPGNYEARFFLNNSFDDVATVSFTVAGNEASDFVKIGDAFDGNSLNPKTQVFNYDSTTLLLRSYLYDFNNPQVQGNNEIGSSKYCKWSRNNNDSIYCIRKSNNNEIINQFYIDDNHITTVTDMIKMNIGNSEGNMALDDKYIVFTGGNNDSKKIMLAIYGKDEGVTQTIDTSGTSLEKIPSPNIASREVPDADEDDGTRTIKPTSGWVSVSPSGEYIVVDQRVLLGDDDLLYDKKFPENQNINYHMMRVFSNPLRNNGSFTEYGNINKSGHGDMVLTDNGEYLIQFESGSNKGVYRYKLNNNGLVNRTRLFSTYGGGHITCQNYRAANNKCFVIFKNYDGTSTSRVYSFNPNSNSINIENATPLLSVPYNKVCSNHKESFRASPSPDGNKLVFQTSYELSENGQKLGCLGKNAGEKDGEYYIYVKNL